MRWTAQDIARRFVIAMWRAKEAESRAYENHNSPIEIFDEALGFAARFPIHRVRVPCVVSAIILGVPTEVRR